MSRIEKIASALEHAERSRTPLPPLSETYPMLAPAEAYAIQSAWFAMKLAQGARLIGRKIGLTSRAMQQQMGTGTGAAVLGHPAFAVAWLANKLAEFGVTLLAGQVILSGSMCGAVPVAPGDTFRATITELGEVSCSFT